MDRPSLGMFATRAVTLRPRLCGFPSSDLRFATIVHEIAAALTLESRRELVDALRPMYPTVSIHRRELEGESIPTWYVYREQSFPARPGQVGGLG